MARGHLPKAYLRIDPNLDQHPDAEGMLFLICAAARQPRRGRFEDVSVVERVLGGRKRAQAFLVPRRPGKEPDVVQLEDGTYYLTGWDEWQEGDFTVSERVARLRAKRDSGVSQPLHGPLQTPLPPSEASRRQGVVRCARDGTPTGVPASSEQKRAAGRPPAVTPPLAAPLPEEPDPTPATPAEAQAFALAKLAIDHDPDDLLQVQIVRRCGQLALRIAQRDGQQLTAASVLEVLKAVSATPGGQTLSGLRYASPEWLAVTLASCDEFERDELGQEPARGSAA